MQPWPDAGRAETGAIDAERFIKSSYNAACPAAICNSTPCPNGTNGIATVKIQRGNRDRPRLHITDSDEGHSPTTATQTCSWRTISATLSSSPTTSGCMNFQFSCGPGGAYFSTADVKPWPIRAPSRSMNQASRFPVSFAELVRAPQYLRSEHQRRTPRVHRRTTARIPTNNHPANLPRKGVCDLRRAGRRQAKKDAYTGRVIHISAMIKTVARPIIRKYSLRSGASPGEKTVPKADRPQMSMLPKSG